MNSFSTPLTDKPELEAVAERAEILLVEAADLTAENRRMLAMLFFIRAYEEFILERAKKEGISSNILRMKKQDEFKYWETLIKKMGSDFTSSAGLYAVMVSVLGALKDGRGS